MNLFQLSWTASLTDVLTECVEGAADLFWPRYWWGGNLDVEGLALSSTRVAATALGFLTGRSISVSSERVAASFASLAHLRIEGRKPQGFAPLSGFHPTRDGWIRLHANYPHHANRLRESLQVSGNQAAAGALASTGALELETRISSAGGVAAAVRSHTEWQATPMARAAARGPWLEFGEEHHQSGVAKRWRAPRDSSDAPLRGLRVLDLTRVVAGPSATRLLGALGADVIRVDAPQMPELIDQHIDTGFCKRSIELDLKTKTGHRKLTELLDQCDVVLRGYRPGALDKFGLSAQSMSSRWPHLKTVSFSAWGWEGPWANRRGFDSIVQAAVGISDIYRNRDNFPGSLPVQALDHATGMGIVAAIAVLLSHEQYSWARTSLARTAHELMKLPANGSTPANLETPTRRTSHPIYGTLEYVPPPLLLDGVGVEYNQLPAAYGSSQPEWLERD